MRFATAFRSAGGLTVCSTEPPMWHRPGQQAHLIGPLNMEWFSQKASSITRKEDFAASTIVEMIKLITPLGMLFTVAMMAVLAVYAFWTSYVDRSWLYFGLGIVSIVACIGVALLRAWSQYLVYLLSAAFVAAWFHSVYTGAAAGYFDFFFSSRFVAAKTLLPGFTLVVLSVAASCIAFRHFRRRLHSH